jgi:CRP-like cAMP-binding protein
MHPTGKGHRLPSLSISPSPRHNRILAALSAAEQARLHKHLELVEMPKGWIVCEAGIDFEWLYFPITSIVSLLNVMADGTVAEIAITGNDGMVGISLLMGGESTTSRAIVQHAGLAYRIKAKLLKIEFALGGKLQYLALRYLQALLTQMAQTAVCSRHHTLEQQLCRWLLLRLDLLTGNELRMTQEEIANTLGVRREGITEVAGRLQAMGMIRYSRGHIMVLDYTSLQQRVCECHATVSAEYQRLLPA